MTARTLPGVASDTGLLLVLGCFVEGRVRLIGELQLSFERLTR